MGWQDPIVEEVRKARDAYAKRFNYDLDVIYRDLKAKERRSGRVVVPCPTSKGWQLIRMKHKHKNLPNNSLQRDRNPRAVPTEPERPRLGCGG